MRWLSESAGHGATCYRDRLAGALRETPDGHVVSLKLLARPMKIFNCLAIIIFSQAETPLFIARPQVTHGTRRYSFVRHWSQQS